MNEMQQCVPFGAQFVSESVVIKKVDPQYSSETQIAGNSADLGTDTYLSWTEDSDK